MLSREEREEFERDCIAGKFEIHNVKPHGVEIQECVKEIADNRSKHDEAYESLLGVVKKNKYSRKCKGVYVDIYDVLRAFNVTNPATAHAIKKLLAAGERGHKDLLTDLKEAHASISRAIDLELEDD